MRKKAQGEIISTVLIILLVLAAIVIVWQVIKNITKGGAGTISDADLCFNMDLDITSATAETAAIANDGKIRVKRGAGAGTLKKIAIVIDGARAGDSDASTLAELGTKEITGLDLPSTAKVEIYAIVGESSHLCGNIADSATVP